MFLLLDKIQTAWRSPGSRYSIQAAQPTREFLVESHKKSHQNERDNGLTEPEFESKLVPENETTTERKPMSQNPYQQNPSQNPYAAGQAQPQPNYQQRGPQNSQPSPLAIVSLVCGIVSLPFSFCCGCFSIPLGLTAVVCGIVALAQMKNPAYSGKGMAVAGIACGGVSLLLVVVLIILQVFLNIGGGMGDFDRFGDF